MKSLDTALMVGGTFTGFDIAVVDMLTKLNYGAGGYYVDASVNLDLNTSDSLTNIPDVSVDAIEVFNGKIHFGGQYYHPDYHEMQGIGYLEPDLSGQFNFVPYGVNFPHDFNKVKMLQTNLTDTKLYIGGDFISWNSCDNVAQIDNSTFPNPSPLPMGSFTGVPSDMAYYAGNLYISGAYRWTGSSWVLAGTGMPAAVLAEHNGFLVGGGQFTTFGSFTYNSIARFNGTAWYKLGDGLESTSGPATINALAVYGNDLYAAGDFDKSGITPMTDIARWDGTSWHPVGTGTDGYITCLEVHDGKLFIGGSFTSINGIPANNIAYMIDSAVYNSTKEIQTQELTYTLYPNPVVNHSEVTLHFSNLASTEIEIISMTGTVIRTLVAKAGETSINIGGFSPGIYLVRLSNNKNTTKKLVVLD